MADLCGFRNRRGSGGSQVNVGLLSSTAALAIVGYTGTVIFQGNLIALVTQLSKDWQFLEVIAAMGVLYYLTKIEYLQGPMTALIGLGVLGVVLKVASNSTLQTAFRDFASGGLDLASLAYIFAIQAGKSLGVNKS